MQNIFCEDCKSNSYLKIILFYERAWISSKALWKIILAQYFWKLSAQSKEISNKLRANNFYQKLLWDFWEWWVIKSSDTMILKAHNNKRWIDRNCFDNWMFERNKQSTWCCSILTGMLFKPSLAPSTRYLSSGPLRLFPCHAMMTPLNRLSFFSALLRLLIPSQT